jgi:LmbE family N-acetylglucosaminyl deacetylase
MSVLRRLRLTAIVILCAGALSLNLAAAPAGQPAAAAPLNIIAFGAHPDDCDIRAGGTAAKWAAAGHRVRFVSVTNGDAGRRAGAEALGARQAKRRVRAAARYRLHRPRQPRRRTDADAAVREQIIRLIRQWKDSCSPRPHDYHPTTATPACCRTPLMVTVPNIAPDTPALRQNPVFMYFEDGFQKPNPFTPDVVVAIDDTFPKKIDAIDAHESQMYEWLPWLNGRLDSVPKDPAARKAMTAKQRFGRVSDAMRATLVKYYGAEAAAKVEHAEASKSVEAAGPTGRGQAAVPVPPAITRAPVPSRASPDVRRPATPVLERRFGLLQATALNMSNMIGIGPFITIPLLMSALGGPQALLGWLVALVIVMADGLVWSELGAAMPGSGGSYRYLREGFGRERWGRLVAFLFIWQFILSGPLEIASGYIGFTQYASYVLPGLSVRCSAR